MQKIQYETPSQIEGLRSMGIALGQMVSLDEIGILQKFVSSTSQRALATLFV